MGLFGSLFSSKSSSSSSSTTNITDQRIGAEGGSAVRSDGGNVFIGSDAVAGQAIDAVKQNSKDTLVTTTDFLGQAFTQVLDLTDSRLQSADKNIAASRDFAANLVSKEQETSDDRLLKIVGYGLLAGVSLMALQSGTLKGILK